MSAAQSKDKRLKNFDEVETGLNKKAVAEEVQRYAPSAEGVCPLGIDIPSFLRHLAENNVNGALAKIREANDFPAICGRVCLAPCEAGSVVRENAPAVAIRALERFAAEHGRVKLPSRKSKQPLSKKVAIIGSGPAGLAAAVVLAKNDFNVVVFESFPHPGGMLRYGIPGFRLPKDVLDEQIRFVHSLGVEILTNCHIGKTVAARDLLQQGFAAVLLATGSGSPNFSDLPGIEAGGVYAAKEILLQLNSLKKDIFQAQMQKKLGRRVIVIGAGNAALDCARLSVRLGREVAMIFEALEEDLRIYPTEVAFGKEEGIKFEPLTKPLEVVIDSENHVAGLKVQRLDYADPDSTGKWQLLPVPGSETVLTADTIITALGYQKISSAKRIISDISCDGDGRLAVDSQTGMTSIKGIFAAGDVASAAGTVVDALASGKKAGEQISQYLQKH